MPVRRIRGGLVIACVITLVTTGAWSRGRPRLTPASGARLSSCAELATTFRFAYTTITLAETVPSSTLTWGGHAIGAHCCQSEMYRRTSPQDGKRYAIGFEMRRRTPGRAASSTRPTADGCRIPRPRRRWSRATTALQRACGHHSDAGHSAATMQLGIDFQARLDYGYQAAAKLRPWPRR